ncbi:ficolin-2-like [Patiria miniata]|uniref:Fibrinogen C-terminal domain-containing protein n=1 Tax=Patiria miniata TaxID=46514 RepID=A0A914AZI3_PATMI|nr:ficolin-2-like [Patiria miniata]
MIDLDSRSCGQRMGRFVLPPGDPCTCTGVRLGGHHHHYAPVMQGQDPPLYMDMLPEVTAEVIGGWFNCTSTKPEESTLGVTETAPESTSHAAPGSTPVASISNDTTPVVSTTFEPSMPPADCQQILDAGQTSSGVYTIRHKHQNMQVYCRMEPESGKGYIVFQRRMDGSVSFNRTWQEYAEGFGNLTGEFWLGNQHLRSLTRNFRQELVITLRAFDGEEARVRYEIFNVHSSEDHYRILSDGFSVESGDAGDSLGFVNSDYFSTRDDDNDSDGQNCAAKLHGGWWYYDCSGSRNKYSNLNGLYYNNATVDDYMGIQWVSWKGKQVSLKGCEMMTRPKW